MRGAFGMCLCQGSDNRRPALPSESPPPRQYFNNQEFSGVNERALETAVYVPMIDELSIVITIFWFKAIGTSKNNSWTPPCIALTIIASSSLTCTSPKSCSDSWLEQPPSSRSPGRMKVNDVKMKWEWPLGACVALPWRNLAPAQDFLDMSSPEQGLGRRLASSTTLHCLLLIPPLL